MGYPTALFVEQNIPEEYICLICLDVLEDPVVSEPCAQHVYCKTCIGKWQATNLLLVSCPADRQEIQELKPPPIFYLNLLNRLQLRCEYSTHGCPEIITVGEVNLHRTRCLFDPAKDYECVNGCGCSLKLHERVAHDCLVYSKGLISALRSQLGQVTEELRVKTEALATFQAQHVGCGVSQQPGPTTSSQPQPENSSGQDQADLVPSTSASAIARSLANPPLLPPEEPIQSTSRGPAPAPALNVTNQAAGGALDLRAGDGGGLRRYYPLFEPDLAREIQFTRNKNINPDMQRRITMILVSEITPYYDHNFNFWNSIPIANRIRIKRGIELKLIESFGGRWNVLERRSNPGALFLASVHFIQATLKRVTLQISKI